MRKGKMNATKGKVTRVATQATNAIGDITFLTLRTKLQKANLIFNCLKSLPIIPTHCQLICLFRKIEHLWVFEEYKFAKFPSTQYFYEKWTN